MRYIVLAHLPIKDGAERGWAEAEWVVFDGVHARKQAEAKAQVWRKWFHEVQIREVSRPI